MVLLRRRCNSALLAISRYGREGARGAIEDDERRDASRICRDDDAISTASPTGGRRAPK